VVALRWDDIDLTTRQLKTRRGHWPPNLL
jgi:hypothetical protein